MIVYICLNPKGWMLQAFSSFAAASQSYELTFHAQAAISISRKSDDTWKITVDGKPAGTITELELFDQPEHL